MDPEAPRNLGDLEDSEPERRPAGRTNPAKRSLDDFLLEFEARLRDHPGEAATSATAALEGRADGTWRTPVEGGERIGRRLPRRVPGRRVEVDPRQLSVTATPPAEPEPEVGGPPVDPRETSLAPAAEPGEPSVAPPKEDVEAPPIAGEVPATAATRRRQRHRRRHRHR